ncbi:winged helix DNA-binding domain-containing protein [Streptomyces tricolor]|nr:winged helix DNA-binding domain-containing protein [Streptomyces tricolor]
MRLHHIHLVTDDDCLALRPLLAEMLARTVKGAVRPAGRRPGHRRDRRAEHRATEARTLTFAELGGALMAERWAGYDANALAQTVRNLVPVSPGPARAGLWGHSGQAAHTTAERWLAAAPRYERLHRHLRTALSGRVRSGERQGTCRSGPV